MIPTRVRLPCAALALVAAFLALQSASPARGQTAADLARYAAEVFRLTNAVRAKQGLPAFRRDARLDRAAALFSRYMGEAGFFAHTGPDGVEPQRRIEKQGYEWSRWGENIANGPLSPQQLVAAWMASPHHRENILNPKFADLGVGIAFVNGNTTMTQDFATERGK